MFPIVEVQCTHVSLTCRKLVELENDNLPVEEHKQKTEEITQEHVSVSLCYTTCTCRCMYMYMYVLTCWFVTYTLPFHVFKWLE